MQRISYIFYLLLLVSSTVAVAQHRDTIYFDRAQNVVSPRDADFFRVSVKRKDSLSDIADFTIKGKPELIGALNRQGQRHGHFRYYDRQSRLEYEGDYDRDKKIGEWVHYFSDGKTPKVKEVYYENSDVLYMEKYDSASGRKFAEGQIQLMRCFPGGPDEKMYVGTWLLMDPATERVVETLTFTNGKMTGHSINYDSTSGKKISEGYRKNGKRDSLWKYYYPQTGKLKVIANFRDGILSGELLRYDTAGNVIEREHYYKGKLAGENKIFYKGGTKVRAIVEFLNGKATGPYSAYDSATSRLSVSGRLENGKRVGEWKFFFPGTDRLQAIKHYKDGYHHGRALFYDSSSRLVLSEGNYVEGYIDGKWTYYYPGTSITESKREYLSGTLHGDYTEYTTDGFKYSVMPFVKGKKDGIWKMFYAEKKKPWFEASFRNDTLDGFLKTYYPNNKIKREEEYKQGKLISATCFGETGKEMPYYPFIIDPEFLFEVPNFIGNNLNYPVEASKENIEGEVLVGSGWMKKV